MTTRTLTAGALATVALAGAAASALADTTLVADPTAANVTAYGSTSAWSRRADDGTYRLVIRSAGAIADAPVPPSSTPFDPDLGPTSDNERIVVYARDGDLYRYEVGSAAETKLGAPLSFSKSRESAPSFYKEAVAFARKGGGGRSGTYLYRPAGRNTPAQVVRLTGAIARETDVAATRVVGRFNAGSKSDIGLFNYDGSTRRTISRGKAGASVLSPTLTRFNVVWLRLRKTDTLVQQVGVNAHRGLKALTATRKLDGRATSLATYKIPLYYTNGTGVIAIEPKLRFPRG